MDYLTSSTKALYRKYLIASLGSALVITIYSFVDTIAVGQSEGPAGTAAMAVISPVFGILVFLGILFGIGGSVLMNNAKGEGNEEKGNAYFTMALLLMIGFTVLTWVLFAVCSNPLLCFFGANEGSLPVVMRYAKWLIRFWPVFPFSVFLGAFVRNDNAPGLVMAGVISGGCFNVFGDWFFVFPLGMGMEGAAIATVLGTTLQCLIICSHLFRKRCRLKLAKPFRMGKAIRKIFIIGIGASLLDLGTVVLSTITNNQILRYGNAVELAIYGVMTTIAALVQAMYCGVGQAIQPLVSANFGARQDGRVRQFLKMSVVTVLLMGVLFTLLAECLPVPIMKLFMDATPEVLTAAPNSMRLYSLLYLFLGFTVLSTYYLQSVMRDRASMTVGILRSLVVSGLLLYILPIFWGINGVWLALPISECVVAVLATFFLAERKDKK